jgi:hypothetical protein
MIALSSFFLTRRRSMAAPAKAIHPFKPADQESGSSPQFQSHTGERQIIRHDFDDRRRMNVSEKLAEGRGFWRGAFVGAAIGVAGGIVASAGIANMWTDQVLKTVQNSVLIGGTLGDRTAAENADLVKQVHPEVNGQPATGPAASSASK